MRRIFLIGIAVFMGLSIASPALGQGRDPFEPQPGESNQDADPENSERDPFNPAPGDADPAPTDPDDPDPAPNDPDDPTDPAVDPTVDPAPTSDPAPNDGEQGTLANTGFDSTTWAAVGYLLIVLGAAAVVVGRVFAPAWSRKR